MHIPDDPASLTFVLLFISPANMMGINQSIACKFPCLVTKTLYLTMLLVI
jgi:hypothetical protein